MVCKLMLSASIFILYVLLLCSFHVYSTARNSLRPGQWINDNEETLVSAQREFELGFFSPTGSSGNKRYVGIWYEWDKRTVVWVANRNRPINNAAGTFGIGIDGNIQVLDTSTGKVHWSTEYHSCEPCTTTNRIVNLTDSGNLVLYNNESGLNIWKSFDHPTDTFLPGMSMNAGINLTSWRDGDDPGNGNFTFMLDQVVGDTNTLIIDKKGNIYWKAVQDGLFSFPDNSISSQSNFSLFITGGGCKYPYSRSCRTFDNGRLVMNFSGKIEYWEHNMNWTWSLIKAEPRDNCSLYNYCGKFSCCNTKNKLQCKCLPGFVPNVPEKWHSGDFSNGCARNFTSCGDSDTFLNFKMLIGETPEQMLTVKNETECNEKCLKSCDCKSYLYKEGLCWIWTQDLYNLQDEYPDGYNLSVRVAISDIEPTLRNCMPCGTNMIPYPLSTSSSCGDPMYFSFDCNSTSGQVSFKAPSGIYQVTSIDPNTRKFFIQVKDGRGLRLNQMLPFNLTSPRNSSSNISSQATNEVEIVWDPPLEPICNLAADCKDWPNSTCKSASDGKRRCLCFKSFRWNDTNLSCTKVSSPSGKRMTLLPFVGITSMIVLCAIISLYVWRRKKTKRKENKEIDRRNQAHRMLCSESHVQDLIDLVEFKEEDEKGIDLPFYDLESIIAATDSFSDENKLGKGGYGPVYKGKLPSGQEIAVKRLSRVSGQGLKEFKNEVVLIAKLQHRNLVRLYGYCIEGDEKILLYEYMPNKSLDFFIFDQERSAILDWELRFNIILGIARGLLYLHQDSRLRIIHRDLKTSNILLDHEMNPKISDFGLARIVGGKQTELITSRVAGTYGYMSPEYALDGIFSIKSDVFSFGVVLLEIISGKKNTGFYRSEQASSLLYYAWRLWTDNKLLDLMDETLRDTCIADQFVKCLNIGLLCVQDEPSDRPTMSIVIKMLDGETVNLPTPKQPVFFIRRDQCSSTSYNRPASIIEVTNSLEGR